MRELKREAAYMSPSRPGEYLFFLYAGAGRKRGLDIFETYHGKVVEIPDYLRDSLEEIEVAPRPAGVIRNDYRKRRA